MLKKENMFAWNHYFTLMFCCFYPALDCSFTGGDFCGFFQSRTDNFDWTLTNQPTASSNTGPAGDHTTGKDYYVYIESSLPQKQGDKAVLISALMPPTSKLLTQP